MKLILAILTLATISATAQAFPILDTLKDKFQVLGAQKPLLTKLSKSDPCTDFTGSWKGTCTDSQGSRPATTVIVQSGCESLQADSRYFYIGGIYGESSTSASFSSNVNYALYWDANQTVLNIGVSGMFKALDTKSAPTTLVGTMSLAIDNSGVLNISGNVMGAASTCTYTKQ